MERSEAVNELVAALAKAQAEIVPAPKDSANPHFQSRYADLATVWEACRGPLTKNGLSVVQAPEPCEMVESGMVLRSTLFHSSGQYLSSTIPLAFDRAKMQSLGSAITYARRYALASLVGVVAEADDDGHQAVNPQRRPQSDVNGHPEHRAPVSQSRPAPTDGAHQHDRQAGDHTRERPQGEDRQRPSGPPRTGRALWAWLKEQEQLHEVGLIRYVANWAKLQDFPERTVDYTTEQVTLAYAEAVRKIEMVVGSN